jgi:putative transposase
LRERWPHWGPKKLRVKLGELDPELTVSAASTIGDWLRREGLVGRSHHRRRCPAYKQPFAAVTAANDVWCTDFKGWFRTADGRRCDPFTLSDATVVIRCGVRRSPDLMRNTCGRSSRPRSRSRGCRWRSVRTMAHLSPHPGWAGCRGWRCGGSSSASGRSGSLPASRSRTGVTSEPSRPRPQRLRPMSGRHSSTTLTTSEPSTTTSDRTRRWDKSRRLGSTSHRRYPDRLDEPSYGPDAAVRRVRSNGQIKWAGEMIFVGEALIGEPVSIVETDSGDWRGHVADIELGYIHQQRRRLSPRPLRGDQACGFDGDRCRDPHNPTGPSTTHP